MGTNWASLLADLFLNSYEAEFVQSLPRAGKKHFAQQFNFTYRYIDDVLSLKNTKNAGYLEFIYPCDLEIEETTETAASSSDLGCYLFIDNRKLTTGLYEAVLTSTHKLCFEQKYKKYQKFYLQTFDVWWWISVLE